MKNLSLKQSQETNERVKDNLAALKRKREKAKNNIFDLIEIEHEIEKTLSMRHGRIQHKNTTQIHHNFHFNTTSSIKNKKNLIGLQKGASRNKIEFSFKEKENSSIKSSLKTSKLNKLISFTSEENSSSNIKKLTFKKDDSLRPLKLTLCKYGTSSKIEAGGFSLRKLTSRSLRQNLDERIKEESEKEKEENEKENENERINNTSKTTNLKYNSRNRQLSKGSKESKEGARNTKFNKSYNKSLNDFLESTTVRAENENELEENELNELEDDLLLKPEKSETTYFAINQSKKILDEIIEEKEKDKDKEKQNEFKPKKKKFKLKLDSGFLNEKLKQNISTWRNINSNTTSTRGTEGVSSSRIINLTSSSKTNGIKRVRNTVKELELDSRMNLNFKFNTGTFNLPFLNTQVHHTKNFKKEEDE